jgi:site-specific recombinase XerD
MHYSPRTEKAYVQWTLRYVRFHGLRHPREMAEHHINAFLTHLAVEDKVSASTQNQALSALLFLYRHVLEQEVGALGEIVRARRPNRLPAVLTREEVRAVLSHLPKPEKLMASLLYGAGLRLTECLQLRAKDLDLPRHPYRPEAPGPQRPSDHHALHPRASRRAGGRAKPTGPRVGRYADPPIQRSQ